MALDPKQVAEMDQTFKQASSTLPRYWWSMYSELVEAGFDKNQAMEVLLAYIEASISNPRH